MRCMDEPGGRMILKGAGRGSDHRPVSATRRPPGRRTHEFPMVVLRIAILLIFSVGPVERAFAQQAGESEQAKIQLMQDLLADKAVQEWLLKQMQEASRPASAGTAPAPSRNESVGGAVDSRLAEIGLHLRELAAAVPRLPGAIGQASSRLRAESAGFGLTAISLLALAFALVGLVAEWLFRRGTEGLRSWALDADPVVPSRRFYVLALRILLALGSVFVFGAVSFGVFTAFSWPDLLRGIVIRFLVALLIAMIAYKLLDVLLSPGNRRLRYAPLSDAAARHFRNRLVLAAGWYFAGAALIDIARVLELDPKITSLIAYVLGLGLLAIGLEMMWRRPCNGAEKQSDAADAQGTGQGEVARNWVYSGGFLAMWLSWVAGLPGTFFLLLIALALPPLIIVNREMIYNIFRPQSEADVPDKAPTVVAALVERSLRAVLIGGAVLLLAYGWKLGLERLATDAGPANRIVRNVLMVLVILLVIDLIWQLMRTLIDVTLEKASDPGEPNTPEAVRRAKLRTLLPIIRNVLLIFLITLAILMSLSALGVQIGPLIASAGVVGIAIGFGTQTLVKDVVSGMFYLLDDAFRVGEYIISGQYRGTVESFSVRSVKLRHHRGPVFTVPFGELGAIQNMSRDYVIDKFNFTVTYDTDLEKARKLLKQVGKELSEDPDLGPLILEPLKMQSLADFGEYGLQIKVKMKCRPGGQYMVRKKAYPLIKQKFDENGIEFAFPTVRIAEEDAGDLAGNEKAAVAEQLVAKSRAGAAKEK